MRNLLVALAVIVALLVVSGITSLAVPGFFDSFLSNLLADLLTATVFTYLLVNFTEFIQRPNLTLSLQENGDEVEEITATKRADGKYEFSIRACVENTGNKSLNNQEGYWHLFFPNMEVSTSIPASTDGENHFTGLINEPIFPGRLKSLNLEFKGVITKQPHETYSVYYFFSTTYGIFPKKLLPASLKGNIRPYKDMGVVHIKCVE